MLPWTTAESSEHGRTLIWRHTRTKGHASKAVYPFFLHSVFAGSVPPFSSFFTAIANLLRELVPPDSYPTRIAPMPA